MNKTVRFYIIFILGFFVYYFFDLLYFKNIQMWIRDLSGSKALAHVIAYSITLIPLILTVKILFPAKEIISLFSLDQSILKGFSLTFLGTLPMVAGYFIFFNLNGRIDIQALFINTLSSAFFEELIFRAFLIGILFRFTALGFLSSIFFGSLLFAQAHFYQSTDPAELIEIFLITFLGSVFFTWVYVETDYNLWTAIFLHFFMNLYWDIFAVSDNVSGNTHGNIFKILSVILIIVLIIYHKFKNKIPFEITGKTLFMKTKKV